MPTTNFPTSLDDGTSLPNPSSSNLLADSTINLLHHNQHDIANDAIKALETAVGITNSTDPTSLQYKIANAGGVTFVSSLPTPSASTDGKFYAISATSSDSAPTYDELVLATANLQNYWPLNEYFGSNWILDNKGSNNGIVYGGNLGSLGGLTDGLTGISFGGGLGMSATGAGGSIDLGAIGHTTGAVTVEAWVNMTVGSRNNPWFKHGAGDGYGLWINASNHWAVIEFNVINWDTGVSTSVSGWHHVVWTTNGTSTQTMYVDGASVATDAHGYNPTTDLAYIGRNITGTEAGNFYGSIQKVAYYTAAMSSSDVSAHYNCGKTTGGIPAHNEQLYYGYKTSSGTYAFQRLM